MSLLSPDDAETPEISMKLTQITHIWKNGNQLYGPTTNSKKDQRCKTLWKETEAMELLLL
jgi:hypothetical protein